MPPTPARDLDERVFELAPPGRERRRLDDALRDAGHAATMADSVDEVLRELESGGTLLLEDEVADDPAGPLMKRPRAQPPWSDLPLIVLTARSRSRRLLERPPRSMTLSRAARIFRVFERPHGTEAYPGTGVGLDSSEGRGSRFWVEHPAAEARVA